MYNILLKFTTMVNLEPMVASHLSWSKSSSLWMVVEELLSTSAFKVPAEVASIRHRMVVSSTSSKTLGTLLLWGWRFCLASGVFVNDEGCLSDFEWGLPRDKWLVLRSCCCWWGLLILPQPVVVEELFPPGLVPMLEQQLRRSLCCDEGPDNEETVTDVELAPAVEAEAEDGNACNNNIQTIIWLWYVINIYWFINISMLQYN